MYPALDHAKDTKLILAKEKTVKWEVKQKNFSQNQWMITSH